MHAHRGGQASSSDKANHMSTSGGQIVSIEGKADDDRGRALRFTPSGSGPRGSGCCASPGDDVDMSQSGGLCMGGDTGKLRPSDIGSAGEG